MHGALGEFVDHLRRAALPVSTSEAIDAAHAMVSIDLLDREQLYAALSATMVKNDSHRATFDIVFNAYFSLQPSLPVNRAEPTSSSMDDAAVASSGGPLGGQSDVELIEMLYRALITDDAGLNRLVAAEAVSRFAHIRSGRPAGVVLYSHRTLARVDLDALLARLEQNPPDATSLPDSLSDLARQMWAVQVTARGTRFRDEVEAEIRRILVADRGPDAVATTLRVTLPQDIEFMHANSEQMRAMQSAIAPLARKLAARVALRRRARHSGPLNMPATVRKSLGSGGAPVEIVTRRPKPHKPQLVVLADISGSVAAFAGFTMQFISAMSSRVARVRAYMFIDGIDEVTDHIAGSRTLGDSLTAIREQARLVADDGHTDYGLVFETFMDRWGQQLTKRTTVLVLGDGRSNYRPPRVAALEAIHRRTARILWLNPEQTAYWNTGDSIIASYAPLCTGVFECRTIRQLEQVASLIE